MAYFPKKQEEEQLAKMNTLGQTTQMGEATENTQQSNIPSGGTSTPASTSSSSPAPKSNQGSGMGADIRKYVSQNKPQTIAEGVNKSTESQAQAVGQQIEKQKSDFLNKVNQQRSMQDKAYQDAQGIIQQTQTLGADQTIGAEDLKRFQQAQNLAPQAPQLDLSQSQGQIEQLDTKAQQAASGSKSDLLRQAFANKGQQYTSGQSNLDELILGGDVAAGEQIISRARQLADQQKALLGQTRQEAQTQAGGLQQQAKDIQAGLQTGIDTEQSNLMQSLQDRLTATETSLGSIPQLNEAFNTGTFTPELLAELGLSDNRMYGVNAQDYLVGSPDIAGIANQSDLARANALAQLAGREQDIFLDPSQIGSYEGAEQSAIQNLRDAVQQAKSGYESELGNKSNVLSELDRIENYIPSLATDKSLLRAITGTDRNARQQNADYNNNLIRSNYMKGLSELGVDAKLAGLITGSVSPNYTEGGQMGRANPSFDDVFTQDYYNNNFNQASGLDLIRRAYEKNIGDVKSKYNYNDVLSAANGGVKNSKAQALKKLLGK